MVAAIAAGVTAATSLAGAVAGAGGQSGAISAGQQQALAELQPYVTAGTNSINQQQNLLGLNGQDAANTAMSTFQSSPGYAYTVQQGLQGIDHGAAAAGTLQSGNTVRAEETLGSNLANQNFQQYYNNLSGLTTSGLNAATGSAQTDTSAANAQSGIIGNEAKNVTGTLTGLAQNSSVTNGLNSLFSSGSGAASTASNLTQFGGFY